MSQRHLLLDCDGTLIDSEAKTLPSLIETICQATGHRIPLDDYHERYRGSRQQKFDVFKETYGKDLPPDIFADRLETVLHLYHTQGVDLAPHVLDALWQLRKWGYKMSIVSDEPVVRTVVGLENAGGGQILEYCEGRVYASPPDAKKPRQDSYRNTMEHLGLKPEDCVAVEDTPKGVLAAKTAGINRVYGYTGLVYKPHFPRIQQELLHMGAILFNDWASFPALLAA